MVVGPDFTREATESDYDAIDELLKLAFENDAEANIVKRLRDSGDMWIEMVMPWNGVIGGYAALSRMKSPDGWACLGPVAVRPEFQNGALAPSDALRRNYSFGTRLVSIIPFVVNHPPSDLAIRKKHFDTVVVLGKKNFYERAGFSSERAQRLISPFPIEHTLIAKAGDDIPEETLVYPDAFLD